MNILIIGSKGFIGQHSVAYFRAAGHHVHEADVIPDASEKYTQLETTGTSFDPLFKNNTFDCCINASGSAHVGFSFEKPDIDFELNVINVHKLLVAIRTWQPKCKLINFSSAAVYGNPESLPINESQTPNPLSPYGFHKLQSEYLLREYHRFFGLSTMSLRIFSAYGPGLKKQLFWDLMNKIKQDGTVSLFGNGSETRDFIYIKDLVKALDLVMHHAQFNGAAFNVASGIETSILEAVTLFKNALSPEKAIVFSGEQKLGDPDNWVADISTLRSIGFMPNYALQDGLIETANWMKQL